MNLEQLNYLFKKYSRVASTNTSVSSIASESLATSGAKAVVQQEDIYSASIPVYTNQADLELNYEYRYTRAAGVGSGIDVLKCQYSGGSWGSTLATISVVSSIGVNVDTATLVQNDGFTVEIWEAFQQSKLYRVYTVAGQSMIVKLEGLVLAYMDGTRDSSPSYYHKLLVNAIPFTFSTAAYSGSLVTSDGTGTIYSDSDGSWIIQSDCGVLQFFNQAATKTLNGSLCNLFPISGATATTWFATAVYISFWKYVGTTGTSTIAYKDDYNSITASFDNTSTIFNGVSVAAPSKTAIRFHEYGSLGVLKNSYDARIYASSASSTLLSSLTMEASEVRLPLLPGYTARSPSVQFGTTSHIYYSDNTSNCNPTFDATPCTLGTVVNALRYRCSSGFIFENASEQALLSITGDTGDVYVKGTLATTGNLTATTDVTIATKSYSTILVTGNTTLLGQDQTFTYSSGVSNTGTVDSIFNTSVFSSGYTLNVASTGAAVTIKGRALQIVGGYVPAGVYNFDSTSAYRPSAYGGALILKAGDYYNETNNGGGYVNMAGGNVYIQSGNSKCASGGETLATLVSPFIQMDVQSAIGYGAAGTRKTMMKIDNTSVLLGGQLQVGALATWAGGANPAPIYMSAYNDSNWGMYVSDTKSLSGGTANTSVLVGSWALRFRCYNATSCGFIFENASESPLFAIRGDGPSKFYNQLEVASGTYCYNSIFVNPSSVYTTAPPALRLWSNTAWAIYMAHDVDINGNAGACDGYGGVNSFSLRFRVDGATAAWGFIWENSSNVCLMSLDAVNGSAGIKGSMTVSSNITVTQTILASSNYLRVEKYNGSNDRYGLQYNADGYTRLVCSNTYSGGGIAFSRPSGDNSFSTSVMTTDYWGNMTVSGRMNALGANMATVRVLSMAQTLFSGTASLSTGNSYIANCTCAIIFGYCELYANGWSTYVVKFRISSDFSTELHSGAATVGAWAVGSSGSNVYGIVGGLTVGTSYSIEMVVYFTSGSSSIWVRSSFNLIG